MSDKTSANNSIYIHVPFCKKRCGYCDFVTTTGKETLIPRYVANLCNEIKQTARMVDNLHEVNTIFFGGGTPTLLSSTQYHLILETIHKNFNTKNLKEVTTEANPGAINLLKLKELHKMGFNRISFGAQAADKKNLTLLNRIHTHEETIQAVEWAREAGFSSINLDLIYGIPKQTITQWKKTLKAILALDPEHLSLYSLILEKNTPLTLQVEKGKLPKPDDDLTADMYELAEKTLKEKGYTHYEISNWAKPGFECLHNQLTWRHYPYFGFGAGAHSFTGNMRYHNPTNLYDYLQKTAPENESFSYPLLLDEAELLPPQEQMSEMVILGLRLLQEGISNEAFYNKFFFDLHEIYGEEIKGLIEKKLLIWDGDSLKITMKGRFLSNQVFVEFI